MSDRKMKWNTPVIVEIPPGTAEFEMLRKLYPAEPVAHEFTAAPSVGTHDLKAAELCTSPPTIGGEPPKSVDTLSAASLTTGSPQFSEVTLPKTRRARDDEIQDEIKKVYDEADRTGRKPPSCREMYAYVMPRLNARDLTVVSKISIERLAHAIKDHRLKPGQRWQPRT